MPIIDIFSKRQKRFSGELPEVLQYNNLPNEFRVQVILIIKDGLGIMKRKEDEPSKVYKKLHDALCREYGMFVLDNIANSGQYDTAVYKFLLHCEDIERCLDVIELSFRLINALGEVDDYKLEAEIHITSEEAINELNTRFLEYGIGYQFENDQLIRVDNKFMHSEVIKPILQVLNNKNYAGANEEFLSAYDHFRHGRYKECLNDCLKSFESTMKIICKKHNWPYDEKDTASKLIEICFQHNLIPSFLQTHFSSLKAGLESGVPTVRNKLSGHGQGTQRIDVPGYLTTYMINLTATSIILLTGAEEALL
jgi:hypothetical protein